MQALIEALKINNHSIFELLHMDFYVGEFLFFPRLAQWLGDTSQLSSERAEQIGILSALLFLSSKIHFKIAEQPHDATAVRYALQLPVLVGDLLYGRFIEYMTVHQLNPYMDKYIAYLKDFHSDMANGLRNGTLLEEQVAKKQLHSLAKQTAFLVGKESGAEINGLQLRASAYAEQQWSQLYKQKITSLEALSALLQQTKKFQVTKC